MEKGAGLRAQGGRTACGERHAAGGKSAGYRGQGAGGRSCGLAVLQSCGLAVSSKAVHRL